uniref:Glycoprotein vOX2-2 n=1 Tax=Elephant endotheliotropic herpesvirus 1A TaxID=759753 RepID=A0A386AUP8_ELHV1|nr:glycoprotein vOX2-2 [Elephant endotheliotropic herpesvirus 1A]AYC62828.1 glycoprotein vOX2-2 [Elephant endotheliotropic herpesvirus 1A]
MEPYVETKSHQLALLNTNVTLECSLINSSDSISVIKWYKNETGSRTNVAIVNAHGSHNPCDNYEGKVRVTQHNMKTSNLTILKTAKNDSSCFVCSFQCGSSSKHSEFSNMTCLTVYAPLTVYISKSNDSSNITCTATSYPSPTVTWIGATNIKNHTRIIPNANGTVSVETTLVIQTGSSINVTCKIEHLENTTLISWSDHQKEHASVSLIEILFLSNSASVISVGILIVLIVMILILVYYKLIRKPGDLIRLYS